LIGTPSMVVKVHQSTSQTCIRSSKEELNHPKNSVTTEIGILTLFLSSS
jgi:hypothetical protein